MSDDLDDSLAPEKPDWRRSAKGVWEVRLPNGDYALVELREDKWRATVTRMGQSKMSRPIRDFDKCVAWAERELFPRRTVWDRIRAV